MQNQNGSKQKVHNDWHGKSGKMIKICILTKLHGKSWKGAIYERRKNKKEATSAH